MARLVVCSIFDMKVQAFAAPFFQRTRGEAMRAFQDACADEKSPFFAHPEDYALFMLSEFDDSEGVFSPPQGMKDLLCSASDFVVKLSPPAGRLSSVG